MVVIRLFTTIAVSTNNYCINGNSEVKTTMNITIKTALLSTLIALIPTTQALGLFGTNPDIMPAARATIPVTKHASIGLSTNPS